MSFEGSSSILETAMVSAEIIQSDIQQCINNISISEQNSYQAPDLTDFSHESMRHLSLLAWINKFVSKEKLARYGFYYNLESDYVKCFFCEVVIGEWGVGDDPLTEHHKHSPDCDFINLRSTNNVPIGSVHQLNSELKEIQNSLKSKKRGGTKLSADLIPRHPDYKDEKVRLQSYSNWPKFMRQTPKDLSIAGFFYLGVGDEVKCFHCGSCLKDWEETDTALGEHKRHFNEQCYFIKKNYRELKRAYSKPYNKSLVKATPIQINAMTKYMKDHRDLKDGKINAGSSKLLYNRMWEELSHYLNGLDGPRKTTRAWKEVWRNHKYNSKRKGLVSGETSPTSDRTGQLIVHNNVTHEYHNYEEYQNQSAMEPDSTDIRLHVYNDNALVSTTTSSTITEYQSNYENSQQTISANTPPLPNKHQELELHRQKCENERLQFELDKLKMEMEKRDLLHQIEMAKLELERTRSQPCDNGFLSYLQL